MQQAGDLLRDRLHQEALIEPFLRGADRLLVVSGYATPAMVSWHFTTLATQSRGKPVDIELIVGMTPQDGLPLESHTGFRSLTDSPSGNGRFKCSYVYGSKSIHSKAYVWMKGDVPTASFMGSANYTQIGFGLVGTDKRGEILQHGSSAALFDYFTEVEASTIGCDHGEVDQEITFYRQFTTERNIYTPEDGPRFKLSEGQLNPLPVQALSLLTSTGQMGARSGLNHGQREGRDPNQAYIPVPKSVSENGFFPPVGGQFTVRTDDGKTMIMACGGGEKAPRAMNAHSFGVESRACLKPADGTLECAGGRESGGEVVCRRGITKHHGSGISVHIWPYL